jgi:transposase-like protein
LRGGLKIDPSSVLFVIDGSKALRKAVKQTFGEEVRIQRCQRHKIENVKGHLPKKLHSSVELTMRQAYQSDNIDTARRILINLVERLKIDHPGASRSLLEGLDEALTVIELGLPKTLRQSLQTTNVIESALSIAEDVARLNKEIGEMAIWPSDGWLQGLLRQRFKRIRGYRDIPLLLQALSEDKELSEREEVT